MKRDKQLELTRANAVAPYGKKAREYEACRDVTMSLLELVQEGQEVLSGLLHSLSASIGLLTRHARGGTFGPKG